MNLLMGLYWSDTEIFLQLAAGRRFRELDRRPFLLEWENNAMEEAKSNEASPNKDSILLENLKLALEEVELHLKGEIELQSAKDFLAELSDYGE